MNYDYERSLALVHTYRVITVPKHCWVNALSALRVCKKQLPGTYYVEGHIEFIKGLYIEHGWLELPEGTIIDTTRAYLETYHGHEQGEQHYYPLLRYTLADLKGVRGSQLPLGMIELHIWQFERYPEEVQQSMIREYYPCIGAYKADFRENWVVGRYGVFERKERVNQ